MFCVLFCCSLIILRASISTWRGFSYALHREPLSSSAALVNRLLYDECFTDRPQWVKIFIQKHTRPVHERMRVYVYMWMCLCTIEVFLPVNNGPQFPCSRPFTNTHKHTNKSIWGQQMACFIYTISVSVFIHRPWITYLNPVTLSAGDIVIIFWCYYIQQRWFAIYV